jgi:hypothetical protein
MTITVTRVEYKTDAYGVAAHVYSGDELMDIIHAHVSDCARSKETPAQAATRLVMEYFAKGIYTV